MTTYTTKQGDILDAIVHQFYERDSGATEQVLEANRELGLADYGPELPAGLVIAFPDIAQAEAKETITRLWE